MGWAQVQCETATYGNSASARTIALPSNVTGGNDLFLGVSTFNSDITVTVADDLANNFTQIGSYGVQGSDRASLWRLNNVTGGARTITVTPSASAYQGLALLELSGLSSSGALATANNNGSSTTPTTGNLTFTQVGALVLAVFAIGTSPTYLLPDGIFGVAASYNQTGNEPIVVLRGLADSTINPGLRISSSAWAGAGAAFAPASAGGGGAAHKLWGKLG